MRNGYATALSSRSATLSAMPIERSPRPLRVVTVRVTRALAITNLWPEIECLSEPSRFHFSVNASAISNVVHNLQRPAASGLTRARSCRKHRRSEQLATASSQPLVARTAKQQRQAGHLHSARPRASTARLGVHWFMSDGGMACAGWAVCWWRLLL